MKEGLLLAFLGGLSGVVLAIIICLLQTKYHFVKLGGQSFIIDYYPVEMQAHDFVLIAAIILVIGFYSGMVTIS